IKQGHIAFAGTSADILLKDKSLIRVSIGKDLSADQLVDLQGITGSEVHQEAQVLHYECSDVQTTNTAVLQYLLEQGVGVSEIVAQKESVHNLYKELVEC
ncbi:MAG: hypothetical protein OCD01_16065, partial [Fibrobacterales bacterium]